MTVIAIVIFALGTVTKRLVPGLEDLEIRGRVEIVQTTALLRSVRILRRVLEIEENCCHSQKGKIISFHTLILKVRSIIDMTHSWDSNSFL